MKRILILSVALAFVVGALGISYSIAQPPPEFKNDVEACYYLQQQGIWEIEGWDTLGECVSTIRTKTVEMCKTWYDCWGYKNVGDCISDFRPHEPPPMG